MPDSPTTPPHLAEPTLRTLTADQFDAFHRAEERGFQEVTPPEILAVERELVDPARFFGFTVGDRWVTTFGSFPRELTVPGGAAIPASAVTAVTVHGAYRRRGLLRRMMTEELRRAADRGETVAALYASESGIYGRFGYGQAAAETRLTGRTGEMTLRREITAALDAAGGSVDEVDKEHYLDLVTDLHDRLRAGRPGSLDRPRGWWDIRLADPPDWREGATPARYVVSYDRDGRVDGHATYRVKAQYDDGNPDGVLRIRELEADSAVGHARLWRYLTSLDLVRTFTLSRAPVDHVLQYLVDDPREIVARRTDSLYVRLVDVPAALRARTYAAPAELTVAVRDEMIADNDGVFELRVDRDDASVRRTDREPELTMDVRELGSIYLGGTSVGVLCAAGLVTEHRAGVAAVASAAFGWPLAPFCADDF